MEKIVIYSGDGPVVFEKKGCGISAGVGSRLLMSGSQRTGRNLSNSPEKHSRLRQPPHGAKRRKKHD